MQGEWLRARSSKYRHFYIGAGDAAICGSSAKPYSASDFQRQIEIAPRCSRCGRLSIAPAVLPRRERAKAG